MISADFRSTDGYRLNSGTSFAAPLVAGALASLYSVDPTPTPTAAARILSLSGTTAITTPPNYLLGPNHFLVKNMTRQLLQTLPLQFRPLRVDRGRVTLRREKPTATFAIYMAWKPASDVVVTLSASKPGKALSTSSLTFTPETWNVAQRVVVSADAQTETDRDIGGRFFVDLRASSAAYPFPVHHSVEVTDKRSPVIGASPATPISVPSIPFTFSGHTEAYASQPTNAEYECTNLFPTRTESLESTALYFELDLTTDCRGGRERTVRGVTVCAFTASACKSRIAAMLVALPSETLNRDPTSLKRVGQCSSSTWSIGNMFSGCKAYTDVPSFVEFSLEKGVKHAIILQNLLESIEGQVILELM